jgi:hypothetical protein
MVPMSFDLDCGEAFGGRRLIATGLRLDGLSDDHIHADYSEHVDGKPVYPMVSLTYRITPALPAASNARDIYATVRLDPPADPAFWEEILAPGAERDATPGAASTAAAIGPFVLPDATERVTIHLVEATLITGEARASSTEADRDLGEVIVDLPTRTARWQPTPPS